MNKTLLSTQPYRGTRDFFPDVQRTRTSIFQAMHKVMKSFGYEEYGGPLLEHFEIYAAKTSEEILKTQLYQFVDQGERRVAIRPEMTPTLARMVAAKIHELPRPIRWYSIPTCMRYERPQRGRLREFDQLNVDLFGGSPVDEDIEIIQTAVSLLYRLGAKPSDFTVRINHRRFMDILLFTEWNFPRGCKDELFRVLDKKDKLKPEVFKEECFKLGLTDEHYILIETLFQKSFSELEVEFKTDKSTYSDLKIRLDILKELLGDCVVFDPQIMRGFDYYTGLVFEIFDEAPDNRRALFGGGRYDDLVGSFCHENLSGIGYGVSDVSLMNFMESHGLLPAQKPEVDIAVVRFGEIDRGSSLVLAQELRSAGLCVLNAVQNTKFGKQIASAERQGALAVVFQGAEELKNKNFAVKWLKTGEQEILNNIPELLKKIAQFRELEI